MDCIYQGYDIESSGAGEGLWPAPLRLATFKPLLVDGALFPRLEGGSTLPDREADGAEAGTGGERAHDFWTEPADDECDIQPFL